MAGFTLFTHIIHYNNSQLNVQKHNVQISIYNYLNKDNNEKLIIYIYKIYIEQL